MATPKYITGKVVDNGGSPRVGVRITAVLSQSCTIPGTQEVPPLAVQTASASDGTWTIQQYATNDLTPNSTFVTIYEEGNTPLTIQVPQGTDSGGHAGTLGDPFRVTLLTTSTPTAAPSPNHVSTLVVDGTSGVAINAAGDVAARSLTVSSSSPYIPTAPVGGFAIGNRMVVLGPPNNVDDTATLQAAQTALVAAGGGVLFFQPGRYRLSGSLTPASATIWVGYHNSTELFWIGATNGTMITMSPASGANVLGWGMLGFVVDANNISGVTPFLLNSWQDGVMSDVRIQNVIGANTAAMRLETAAGTDSSNNTTQNVLRNIHIKNAPVGIQFFGQNGGTTTFVTNNRFFGLNMQGITQTGIRFVQWCDSNAFYGVEIGLGANNAVGIILNDSATPAVDVGVYNVNFHHVSIDSFGITGATGILFNVAKQSIFYDFYHSPVVFNGTLINDNLGRAASYDIVLTQDNNSTNNIVRLSKNLVTDSGAGAGGGTYANWLVMQAAAAGNAATLASVGTDSNPNIQLLPKGSGNVFVASELRVGPGSIASGNAGDLTISRGGVSPGTGFLYFGSSAQGHYIGYPGNFGYFSMTDNIQLLSAQSKIRPGATSLGFQNSADNATNLLIADAGSATFRADIRRSRQTPTETVLVSGVDATAGELVGVTLTAARVVGAPLNPATGQRLVFTLIQSGAGAFAVTWNAIFKGITGGTSGATPTRATFSFNYDGTNWNLDGAQPTWV